MPPRIFPVREFQECIYELLLMEVFPNFFIFFNFFFLSSFSFETSDFSDPSLAKWVKNTSLSLDMKKHFFVTITSVLFQRFML